MADAGPATSIYLDVDDTLGQGAGSARRPPLDAMVERVRELARRGGELYLWSASGAEHARATARALGIEACFRAFLPKPQVVIDAQALEDWNVSEIHPAACPSMRLEDILRRRR
jgi:hypothetical protein